MMVSVDLKERLTALDAALDKGISDADAGRAKLGDEVLDRLEAKYKAMAEADHHGPVA